MNKTTQTNNNKKTITEANSKKRIYEKRQPNKTNTAINIYVNQEDAREVYNKMIERWYLLFGFWDIDKTALVACKIFEKYWLWYKYMITFYK